MRRRERALLGRQDREPRFDAGPHIGGQLEARTIAARLEQPRSDRLGDQRRRQLGVRRQQPSALRHRPPVQSQIEVLLHRGRIEHRQPAGLEDVVGLMRQGRTLGAVVVARQRDHAAVAAAARGIGMLEDIAAARPGSIEAWMPS